MEIGYARVSTSGQSTDLQIDALTAAGVTTDHIYNDVGTGRRFDRPGLEAMLSFARSGDRINVYSLSRLGRSTSEVLQLVAELTERGVGFRSLSEGLDTGGGAGGNAFGRVLLTLIAAIATLESDLMRERTRDGLAATRARGTVLGRPPALSPEQVSYAKALHEAGSPVSGIARSLNVSRGTIYRALAADRVGAGDGTMAG